MYQTHPLIKEPKLNTKLWRYINIINLISILDSKTLFFSKITTFEDPFEGHPPRPLIEAFKKLQVNLTGEDLVKAKERVKNNIEFLRNGRNLIFVSCWHTNEIESDAMWKLYGKEIAIKTTFERFKKAFDNTSIQVSGGMVEYIDHDTYDLEQINLLSWSMLKSLSFKHEEEFRGVIITPLSEKGIAVPIDVESLIEEIYVSPTTPDWIEKLLQTIISNKYNLNRNIKRSKLGLDPSYYTIE